MLWKNNYKIIEQLFENYTRINALATTNYDKKVKNSVAIRSRYQAVNECINSNNWNISHTMEIFYFITTHYCNICRQNVSFIHINFENLITSSTHGLLFLLLMKLLRVMFMFITHNLRSCLMILILKCYLNLAIYSFSWLRLPNYQKITDVIVEHAKAIFFHRICSACDLGLRHNTHRPGLIHSAVK